MWGLMAGVAAVVTAGCGAAGSSRASTSATSSPLTVPTTTTTAPVNQTVATPPPTDADATTTTTAPPTTLPAPTITSTTLPLPVKGTIDDANGQPVPNAVLIDAQSLQVVHADGFGRFSLPYCAVLSQLWVADWVIPLGTSYPAYYGKQGSAGGSTTFYGSPPTGPGSGYARLDTLWPQWATDPAPCHGESVDVRLPAGGGVDITWMAKPMSGPEKAISGPVNGYYEILPGLPYDSGTYTPTADPTGHQVIQHLGAGGMAINSSSSPFTCAGDGVERTSGSSWQVAVVAGHTDVITCTVP
jgi:hypothetical protein